jgi:hypothetical protein
MRILEISQIIISTWKKEKDLLFQKILNFQFFHLFLFRFEP